MKCENKTDEMIDILEELQENYVPTVTTVEEVEVPGEPNTDTLILDKMHYTLLGMSHVCVC